MCHFLLNNKESTIVTNVLWFGKSNFKSTEGMKKITLPSEQLPSGGGFDLCNITLVAKAKYQEKDSCL